MTPPFTADQFFAVFSAYNQAVWPAQAILATLGFAAVVLALKDQRWRGRTISAFLGGSWAWMAIVYHWGFFKAINPAAAIFAAMFLAQAALLLWFGFRRSALRFEATADVFGAAGGFFIAFALVVYPMLGLLTGRGFATQPSFGLPCPTTIFTMGLLMWAKPRVPWTLLVIPAGWAIVGFSAVRAFGVIEDVMLPVAALGGAALIVWRNRRPGALRTSTMPERSAQGPGESATNDRATARANV